MTIIIITSEPSGQPQYEDGKGFTELVTSSYCSTPQKYRGLHKSAISERFTTPLFYNSLGWVDFGYKFACKLFPNCILQKERNTWGNK